MQVDLPESKERVSEREGAGSRLPVGRFLREPRYPCDGPLPSRGGGATRACPPAVHRAPSLLPLTMATYDDEGRAACDDVRRATTYDDVRRRAILDGVALGSVRPAQFGQFGSHSGPTRFGRLGPHSGSVRFGLFGSASLVPDRVLGFRSQPS